MAMAAAGQTQGRKKIKGCVMMRLQGCLAGSVSCIWPGLWDSLSKQFVMLVDNHCAMDEHTKERSDYAQ